MTTILISLRKLAIVVLAASLLTACGGKEERKAKYLERGKTYFAEGNYDKAQIEFKNVLQIDPKDAQGHFYLGRAEENRQEWRKAFRSYKKATELDPELVEPRVRLARFYMAQASSLKASGNTEGLANALGMVQDEINEIRGREPNNLDASTLEAMLWLNDGEVDKAIAQFEAVISSDPGLESAVISLAALYEQRDMHQQAESILLAALERNTDDLQVNKIKQRLAAHYIVTEQNAKAEDILGQLVEAEPEELAPRVSLASFLSRTEQIEKAEKVLKDAVAADPDDAQRYLLLAEFLASTRGGSAGVEALEKYSKQNPDMGALKLALARLFFQSGKAEEARGVLKQLIVENGVEPDALKARILLAKSLASEDSSNPRIGSLIDEVLAENPRDNEALFLKGKLAAGRQDYVEAIADFRSVLKDQPNNADVMTLLAASHDGNGERALALDTLRRGIENNPDNKALRLSLAKLLAKDGDIDQAIEQLDDILELDSKYMPAMNAKYELLALRGDADGMLGVVKEMQSAAPEDESVQLREAKVYFVQKKYDDSLRVADEVLSKNAESIPALRAKSEVLATQARYDDALPIVQEIIRIQPDSADGYYLRSRLLIALERESEAVEQLEIAIEKAPNSRRVLTEYASLQSKRGNSGSAKQRIQGLLDANPEHDSANAVLGIIAMSETDYVAAEKAFDVQVKNHPGVAADYSALAGARVATGDLLGAASAIEAGLEANPGNMTLLIGLAGIQEQQENFEGAILTYEKALAIQPDNAVSTNNLVALISDHRTDQESLARALELSAKLEKTQQPEFLDTAAWVYYRVGQYEKAAEILEGVVEQAPKLPVFHYHLGMAYSKLGNKEAARKHLSLATDGEYNYAGLDEARATLEAL